MPQSAVDSQKTIELGKIGRTSEPHWEKSVKKAVALHRLRCNNERPPNCSGSIEFFQSNVGWLWS
jgi:hypothetical protein